MNWESFTYHTSKKFKRYLYRLQVYKNIARLKYSRFNDLSSIYITSSGATDGGCAQLLRQISTIAFTKSFGFSYIHTPLTTVQHNVNNESEWTAKWDNFLQLAKFSDMEKDGRTEFKVVKNLNELIPDLMKHRYKKDSCFYQIFDCYPYTNMYPVVFLPIKKKLRRSYEHNNRAPKLLYPKNTLNIAIHVRRGDVTESETPERFTSAIKLKTTIQRIEKVLGSNNYKITLFCIEKYPDLEKLESKNVRLIYKLDIFDVLDHLIHADMLVTSKSSVGYISAIINKGIILYEPFWHPPLRGWLNMENNFDKHLKNQLTEIYPERFTPYSSGW